MKFPAPPATLLSAATVAAAAFFLAGTLSSATTPAASSRRLANLEVAQSEIEACERAGARSHSACVAEAEGKALIRRAEWIAALEESSGDSSADGVGSLPGVIVLRAPRVISR